MVFRRRANTLESSDNDEENLIQDGSRAKYPTPTQRRGRTTRVDLCKYLAVLAFIAAVIFRSSGGGTSQQEHSLRVASIPLDETRECESCLGTI